MARIPSIYVGGASQEATRSTFEGVRHANTRDLFTTIGYCWLFTDRVDRRPEERR